MFVMFFYSVLVFAASDKIRLNSLGFKPGSLKRATIAVKCGEISVKSVLTGKTVYKGKAEGPFESPETSEKVYIFDFTTVEKPGIYYIDAGSAGKSFDFKIAGIRQEHA